MAGRFWKAQPASAIADNGSGKCRVTVASTTGMTTGDSRLFFSFTGTTGLNGQQTITVIDGTHLDVTAVSFVATGTGSINGYWDGSNTNNWVSSSGGTDYGQTVPGSSDNVTFDGSSGGGTVTLNLGGSLTILSLGLGAFTGTWDNSVNNNNITATASSNAFNLSGSGTRTIKLGTATYTATSSSGSWAMGTVTNLTFQGDSATIAFTNNLGGKTFRGGGKTYGTLSVAAQSGNSLLSILDTNTFGSLSITAPCCIELTTGAVTTVSNPISIVGSSSNQIGFLPSANNSNSDLALASGSTFQWCAFRGVAFSGSPSITNSFNLGNNSGATINGPTGGGALIGMVG